MVNEHEHKFNFVESSVVNIKTESYFIDKYRCKDCERLLHIDRATKKRVNLGGAIGEEVE